LLSDAQFVNDAGRDAFHLHAVPERRIKHFNCGVLLCCFHFFLFSKSSLISGIKKAALEGGSGERRKTNA
jgi:hypothetical protein